MVRAVGNMSALIVGLVKNWLSMSFLSVHHMIPRDQIFGVFDDGVSFRCF